MNLTSWELTDDLESAFHDLQKYAQNNLYAFQHGENKDLSIEFRGYISNAPGIILDITNCFSFNQSEIEGWRVLFLNYGASNVRIGMDTMTRTITIYIYYDGRRVPKKSTLSSVYKCTKLPMLIPTFVWIYLLLLVWNPPRYQML